MDQRRAATADIETSSDTPPERSYLQPAAQIQPVAVASKPVQVARFPIVAPAAIVRARLMKSAEEAMSGVEFNLDAYSTSQRMSEAPEYALRIWSEADKIHDMSETAISSGRAHSVDQLQATAQTAKQQARWDDRRSSPTAVPVDRRPAASPKHASLSVQSSSSGSAEPSIAVRDSQAAMSYCTAEHPLEAASSPARTLKRQLETASTSGQPLPARSRTGAELQPGLTQAPVQAAAPNKCSRSLAPNFPAVHACQQEAAELSQPAAAVRAPHWQLPEVSEALPARLQSAFRNAYATLQALPSPADISSAAAAAYHSTLRCAAHFSAPARSLFRAYQPLQSCALCLVF